LPNISAASHLFTKKIALHFFSWLNEIFSQKQVSVNLLQYTLMNISMPNKERYIVDSNIFYALFVSDDTLHDDAMALFAIIDTAELIVTYGVIQEVTTLLTYRKGKKIADGFVQHLLDAGNVMLFS
jgi:hypothetical protein